jgi:tetratricopeptide (TPR) repeat protein
VATLVSDLHTILPGLPPPVAVEPEQARFRMFEAFATMLRNAAARRPLVVVLDDLHWADEASLRLLQFLARELGPARLLLVGTYRDVELRRGHPLADTLAELSRHRATERVLLHGLDAADVERFITETAGVPSPRGLAEVVHRETEGNPFFVHEVVRLLAAQGKLARAGAPRSWSLEIPQGVKEVIGRRLDRLSPSCNEALGVASVLGREFDLPVVARVADKPEIALLEALDEALSARVVVEVKEAMGRYRFSHALVRETLYDDLSAARRVSFHRAAGEALDRSSGEIEGPRLAEIAHHYFQSVQAGDAERTLAACERAAEWARTRNAWEDAALHLEHAVQVLERSERPDASRLYGLLVQLAELQAFGSEPEKTRATALRAAELARRIGSGHLLARAALAYGAHLPVIEMGRADEAMVSLLEEALQGLGEEDAALRARVLQRLADELYFSLDWRARTSDRAHEVLQEALRLAEAIGDPALQASIGLSTTLGIRNDLHDGVAAEAEGLIALARQGNDPAAEQNAWNAFAAGSMWLGDMDAVRRALIEMERLAAELRTPLARYQALRLAGAIAVLEGRFDEASSVLRDAIRIAGTAAGGTNVKQWAGLTLWFAARHRGTPMNVEQSFELVERFLGYNIYRVILCGVYLSTGARNEALRELGILATDDFGRIEANASWVPVHALAADLSWDMTQSRYAETLYDRLLSSAGRCPSVWPMAVSLGPVDLRLGRLALLRGRYAEAERHLQDAIEICRRMGARPYLAEAHYALALALAHRGGDDDRMGALASFDEALSITSALASLDEALSIARELAMAPLIEAALALKSELAAEFSTDAARLGELADHPGSSEDER